MTDLPMESAGAEDAGQPKAPVRRKRRVADPAAETARPVRRTARTRRVAEDAAPGEAPAPAPIAAPVAAAPVEAPRPRTVEPVRAMDDVRFADPIRPIDASPPTPAAEDSGRGAPRGRVRPARPVRPVESRRRERVYRDDAEEVFNPAEHIEDAAHAEREAYEEESRPAARPAPRGARPENRPHRPARRDPEPSPDQFVEEMDFEHVGGDDSTRIPDDDSGVVRDPDASGGSDDRRGQRHPSQGRNPRGARPDNQNRGGQARVGRDAGGGPGAAGGRYQRNNHTANPAGGPQNNRHRPGQPNNRGARTGGRDPQAGGYRQPGGYAQAPDNQGGGGYQQGPRQGGYQQGGRQAGGYQQGGRAPGGYQQRDNQNRGGRPGQSRNQNQSYRQPVDPTYGNNESEPSNQPLTEVCGVLEMHPSGFGFLREPAKNYAREKTDAFVPEQVVARYGLREGLLIRGLAAPQRKLQGPRLQEVLDIDGRTPDEYRNVKTFDSKTPINPEEFLRLETTGGPISTRVIDLLAPLGKGQRALIVAPPRTGKTVLLQQISTAVSENHPELKLIVLLIDERPEEVTEMRRQVRGEVVYSSLDRDVENHARLAALIIERAKRLAEMGEDVFVLMDSITRLARAFNKLSGNNRTMTGGIDIKAMDIPKKLFATARCFEEGGSLTIVATALIDTGSKMDEVIFQEFKGTGNMELVLDRKLADRRVWPSIDIGKSGTRRDEKLLDPNTLNAVTKLRRTLDSMNHIEAMEQLTRVLGRFPSNREFIHHVGSTAGR